jgi:subtilisin family serine protease
MEYNSREIVGDDYSNSFEQGYGNNNIEGEFALHGTHVAGIIGASKNNGIGVEGIADHVEIVCIRVVPDGDEHDKDVANAIRYAVDNGAQVINMSFGKGQSWDKSIVDIAVRHAQKKDVLIIHAAGNNADDNDEINHYPIPKFDKSGFLRSRRAKNWIEVGAASYANDENIIAGFSNYGKKSVDLFAPGVAIYSTAPGNAYQFLQGTSMAAPVVAGVAALIRSYFPGLTAKQVKKILLESATPMNEKVIKPGTYERVFLGELSNSGGIINAASAFEIAKKTKGKKKFIQKSRHVTT